MALRNDLFCLEQSTIQKFTSQSSGVSFISSTVLGEFKTGRNGTGGFQR